jgi:hypothetical protein
VNDSKQRGAWKKIKGGLGYKKMQNIVPHHTTSLVPSLFLLKAEAICKID